MRVRRSLWWFLVVVGLLSAAALWWPRHAPAVVDVVAARVAPERHAVLSLEHGPAAMAGAGVAAGRTDVRNADWLLVAGNPFADAGAGPVPADAPASSANFTPVAVAPPATPSRPELRFLGRFTRPDGQVLLYAVRGTTPVQLKLGDRLDGGAEVESIEPTAVILVYPADGSRHVVPLPEEPSSGRQEQ